MAAAAKRTRWYNRTYTTVRERCTQLADHLGRETALSVLPPELVNIVAEYTDPCFFGPVDLGISGTSHQWVLRTAEHDRTYHFWYCIICDHTKDILSPLE